MICHLVYTVHGVYCRCDVLCSNVPCRDKNLCVAKIMQCHSAVLPLLVSKARGYVVHTWYIHGTVKVPLWGMYRGNLQPEVGGWRCLRSQGIAWLASRATYESAFANPLFFLTIQRHPLNTSCLSLSIKGVPILRRILVPRIQKNKYYQSHRPWDLSPAWVHQHVDIRWHLWACKIVPACNLSSNLVGWF